MILAQRFLYRSLRAQIFEKKVSNFSKTPKKKIVSRSWAKIGLRKTQPNVCSKKKSRGARTLFSKFGSYSPFPNTSHRTPFSLPMPALTPSTRWPCYCSSYCCVHGWSSGRATEPILHYRCCRAIGYVITTHKNTNKIWYV